MPPPQPKSVDPTTITVVLDGTPYVLHPMDVSAFDESKLRQSTGFTMATLMASITPDGDGGLDSIAALAWLARRQAGETELPFRLVAESIDLNTSIDIQEPPESEAPDAGEAPAAATGGSSPSSPTTSD